MTDLPARLADAAPRGDAADLGSHAIPRFEGPHSRRHMRRPVWALRLRAEWEARRRARRLAGARTLVQFVGFPRSGHSLIGSLLDAHAEATVAHELDAMGLFLKGLPVDRIAALMDWNSEVFSDQGRWWNGFSYALDGAPPPGPPRVVGDKKGDWAARWCAADPSLIDRFRAATPLACRWILVTRSPFDNVATMTLRRGGEYDRLRIAAASGAAFREDLAAAQADGRIAAAADDAMIADYRGLCAATAAMKARVPSEEWLEVVYERFTADPGAELDRILRFVELDPDPALISSATDLVRAGGSRSRDKVTWSDAQRDALDAAIAEHDFLGAYRDG